MRCLNQRGQVKTANAALKRIGYGGKLVAYGLRAIASTALNQHGFNADVIEAALAHSDKMRSEKLLTDRFILSIELI